MKARVCIIGNGDFANKVHLPSLASMDDVEIAGLFAFNAERLRQTGERYGIAADKLFAMSSPTDYQQHLLRIRPDGVYAIGQPQHMLDVWYWCLQQGFPLFIEKPMGLTWHQARMLAHLAEKHGCITQVSLQRRSSPLLQYLHAQCLARGPVTHAVVSFNKFNIGPMVNSRDRMLDDFVHCVDTARWLCGGDVVNITATCRSILTPDLNWIGAGLHFNNGAVCYAVGNWSAGRRVFRVEAHSPGISIESEPEKEGFIYADGDYNGVRYDAMEIAGSTALYMYGGFHQKNREFISSVRSGIEKTSSPFKDVLQTMKVCESILAQNLLSQYE